ncbi:MAG: hypothetical protein AAF067_04340 [Pseudomonadota bacterium]
MRKPAKELCKSRRLSLGMIKCSFLAPFVLFANIAFAETVEMDLSQLSKDQLFQLYLESEERNPRDVCHSAELLSEMFDRGVFLGPIEEQMHRFGIDCAVNRRDWEQAYQHTLGLEKLFGKNPLSEVWGFTVARYAGKGTDAVDRLIALSQADTPDQLLQIESDSIFRLSGSLHRNNQPDEASRMFVALHDSPHFSRLEAALQSVAASSVLKDRLKRGISPDAEELLLYVRSPYKYLEMLSDRSYENAWPAIEERAGKNLKLVLEDNLAFRKRQFELDKSNKKTKQELAHALHFAGKFEEVIALTDSIDDSSEGRLEWDEDDGWALNLRAYAFDAMGDIDKADKVLDQFASIPYLPSKNGWLVNFTINRATRLVSQSRFAEGLAAANQAGEIALKSGSPYAKMLVWNAKACAAFFLGKTEEAEENLRLVQDHEADSFVIAAETYLCFGKHDKAAELAVKALHDDTHRAEFIHAMRNPAFGVFYGETTLPTIYGVLRTNSQVDRAFTKFARDIPQKFTPMNALRRAEIKAALLPN